MDTRMDTNEKYMVAAANEYLRKFQAGDKDWVPGALMGHAYLAGFFAGADWQKQREKPVNGELEGED